MATTPKFGKSIQRVTILTNEPGSNQARPVEIYRSSKKKKSEKALKPLERMTRRDVESRKAVLDDYLERHRRSNARKSNGWIRDLGKNVFKSLETGRKRLEDMIEEDEDLDDDDDDDDDDDEDDD